MRNPDNDVAGVIVPPPLIFAAAVGLGVLGQRARPASLLPARLRRWRRPLGFALLAGGFAAAGWAVRTMHRVGADPNPSRPVPKLATDGPFRFSRNPIYLSMTAAYAGIILLRNSLWGALLLPGVLAILRRGVIEREERYLARRFGETYEAYRARVRRWL